MDRVLRSFSKESIYIALGFLVSISFSIEAQSKGKNQARFTSYNLERLIERAGIDLGKRSLSRPPEHSVKKFLNFLKATNVQVVEESFKADTEEEATSQCEDWLNQKELELSEQSPEAFGFCNLPSSNHATGRERGVVRTSAPIHWLNTGYILSRPVEVD